MASVAHEARRLARRLLTARRGFGPLLERDYWALVEHCRMSPSEVMELVGCRFEAFAPVDIARFRRRGREGEPLEEGDELEVRIRGAGTTAVRVLHRDAQSLTLGTVEGHPEAGRITFGAYRNDFGDVIFHIRSRARSSSRTKYAGFLALGEAMQTTCWTTFVNTVACTVGEGVVGYVHAVTSRLGEDEAEHDALHTPTFFARGD